MSAAESRYRLLAGGAWSVGGAAISRAFLLAGSVFLGRLLGASEFGKLGMLQNTAALFGALFGATLGVTATRFVAHARGADRAQAGGFILKAYRLGLWSGGAGAALSFLLAPLIGEELLRAPELVPLLRPAALLVFFGTVNGVQLGILAGLAAFRPLALTSIVRGVSCAVAMVLFATKLGVAGALLGQVVGEVLSAALCHAAILKAARAQGLELTARPMGAEGSALVGFALPTLLATLALQPVLWFCGVLLANQPGGFAELGVFTAADRWRQVLLFLPASLSASVLSTLSQLEGEGDQTAHRRVFRQSLSLILLAVLVPGALMAALAPACLALFGAEYAGGARTLIVLVACCLPIALNTSLGQLLQARGLGWWRFGVDAVMAALLLVTALRVIPSRGAEGFALSQLVAYSGAVVTLGFVLWRLRRTDRGASQPLLVHITTVPETLRFVRGQVGYMRRNGFAVEVISSPGRELDSFRDEEQVRAWALPMARRISLLTDVVALVRLCLLLLRLRPTILHAHTPKAGLLGMIAATATFTPVRIYHLCGLPLETAKGLTERVLKLTERLSCALSHWVHSESRSLTERVLALGLTRRSKIRHVASGGANGIDARGTFDPDKHQDAAAAVRLRLNIPPSAEVIGFVGRIVRDKGIVELTEAWQTLRTDFPNAHLVIVGPVEKGDAVPKSTLDALAKDPRVHLLPPTWDIAPYMAAMDLLALPSYREGMGAVVLEAAALRVPTVAFAATGSVDSIVDGQTGALVPLGDTRALGGAIARYLRSPELRRAHGAVARDRVLREFEPEVLWRAILGEYELQLARVRGRGAFPSGPRATAKAGRFGQPLRGGGGA